METLERILATGVVQALQSREHVLVAPGSGGALLDEVEEIIAPTLATITSNLSPHQAITGEITNTFGDDAADEAVESVVQNITDQLMESDNVDDIFAEDRLIRRDTFRAIQTILTRYTKGEIKVEEVADTTGTTLVSFEHIGYVANTVSQLAELGPLESALQQAAQTVGVTFVNIDEERTAATFSVGDNADCRLALEEAITEELIDLVDNETVELPSIEQILQVDTAVAHHANFAEALLRAARDTQQSTGCGAACNIIDAQTLLVTLTPLTAEDAAAADTHFAYFLNALEQVLAALDPAD